MRSPYLQMHTLHPGRLAVLLLLLPLVAYSQGVPILPPTPAPAPAPRETAAERELARVKAQLEQERRDRLAAEAKAQAEARARADAERPPRAAAVVASAPSVQREVVRPYPGGPELLELPRAVADVPGTLLGQASGGNSDEQPTYRVRVPYRLAIGRTEVSFEQWDLCVAEGGCQQTVRDQRPGRGDQGWGRGKQPVIGVNWFDVSEFLVWLNRKAGIDPASPHRYRLPTEAEWEYAARAGSDGLYSLGPNNDLRLGPQTAQFDASRSHAGSATGERRFSTVAVDSFAPNAWGLHQMHGNVGEWVQDCYDPNEYQRRAQQAGGWLASQFRDGPMNCLRVFRGGAWPVDPQLLRSAKRDYAGGGNAGFNLGFRVARTLP